MWQICSWQVCRGVVFSRAAGRTSLIINNKTMNIIMKNDIRSKAMEYNTPVCEVLSVGIQSVICSSETEKVTETEGEW